MGRYTWDIIREEVEAVIVVNDAEIARAMRQIWERMKQVVEPSAAVALAALLAAPAQRLRGHRRVGVILSGGNVDLGQLPWGPESQAPERPAG